MPCPCSKGRAGIKPFMERNKIAALIPRCEVRPLSRYEIDLEAAGMLVWPAWIARKVFLAGSPTTGKPARHDLGFPFFSRRGLALPPPEINRPDSGTELFRRCRAQRNGLSGNERRIFQETDLRFVTQRNQDHQVAAVPVPGRAFVDFLLKIDGRTEIPNHAHL